MNRIVLPYQPRPHQLELHNCLRRFNVFNIHRRFGKTVFAVNQLIKDATQCKLERARCAYIAPYRNQAKQIAWEYLKHFSSPIPGMKYNESDLRADFPTGARITLYGGDNPNALRGIYLDSVVLDETAQMSPMLWRQVIRPLLADRKGKAIFIGTPWGMKNFFYEMYEQAGEYPQEWARATMTALETDVIDKEELEAAERSMSPEEFKQEFLCSWSAAIKGAYYSAAMELAESEGRITDVQYDENHPVIISCDLGWSDATVVWYYQLIGTQIRAIRCEAFQGKKMQEILQQVHSHNYFITQYIAPFDLKKGELGSGRLYNVAKRLGVKFDIAPSVPVMEGINAVRALLPRMVFDRANCRDGIEALKTYRSEYNELRQVFSNKPLHDWASDFADSMRYFAVTKHKTKQRNLELDYSQLDKAVI